MPRFIQPLVAILEPDLFLEPMMTVSHTPSDVEPTRRAPDRPRSRKEAHLTIVAAAHIALGTIGVLIFGFGLLVVLGSSVWMFETDSGMGMGLPSGLFGTVVAALAIGVFVLLSLPGIIGGIGLLLRQGWARVVLLVVSFIQLINIPFGTALGIYTIWVLLQDETRIALSRSSRGVD